LNRAITIITVLLALLASIQLLEPDLETQRIHGICLEAPPKKIGLEEIKSVQLVNADWIAVIPYAFIDTEDAKVRYNYDQRWWGEGISGASETIRMAKELGLKIMLKPHVWVRSQGWAGDFSPESEPLWKNWEDTYKKYILEYAEIAEKQNVEMICIGTEFRKTVIEKPTFWNDLIVDVKKIYSGKLTYAANWDNYENVSFWDELDYIGIDAYFPISDNETPDIKELSTNLEMISSKLEMFSKSQVKPILFTEYGFRSIDYTAAGHWKYDADTLSVNMDAQKNALTAFYNSLWDENWCAGGFLWKWHALHDKYGGAECKRYTPQNKPAQNVVAEHYKKSPITK